MTKRLFVAVLLAVLLDLLAAGYGTVAAGHEDQAACARDHGTVRAHERIKDGRVIFGVPL